MVVNDQNTRTGALRGEQRLLSELSDMAVQGSNRMVLGSDTPVGISFDASKVVPTGQENKPYSIRGLYLIAYWNIMGGFSITGPLQNMISSGAFRTESQIKAENDGLAGGSFWREAGVGSTTFGFSLSYYDPAHAVGPDIKPYSVKTLYLISY